MTDPPFSTTATALHPGDLLRCPHCRHGHLLTRDPLAPHEHVRAMLFFECRKGRYFAGRSAGARDMPPSARPRTAGRDAPNTIEQLMERIARLETMTLLPGPRVPGDLTGRIWKLEDQLRSFGAAMEAGISESCPVGGGNRRPIGS
jgi:hypothetical protein